MSAGAAVIGRRDRVEDPLPSWLTHKADKAMLRASGKLRVSARGQTPLRRTARVPSHKAAVFSQIAWPKRKQGGSIFMTSL